MQCLLILCSFSLRIILRHLSIALPHDGGFSNVKNSYFNSGCYSTCDDYGVNVDEIWMNKNWFHTPAYGDFSNGRKTAKRSFSGNLAGWIITQFKVFTRNGIEKISKSIRTYVSLIVISQV